MKSVYRVLWTDHALEELRETFNYLQLTFSEKEIRRLAEIIETALRNISKYPELYPESSNHNGARRAVVTRFNTLYYRVRAEKKQIEVLSFFSTRQDPGTLEL